ncbi:MAG: bifunctional riboflavin kinase/FAD synthetase [Candidatus Omnitrophica bacterium]|nr:bifunctional riboflavin kinase/FAD synthetase [Candidatus Omnitrophota bacterium]
MKVIYGIGKAEKKYRKAVLAIGVFDGVHVGHQKLIKKAVERAKVKRGQTIVMTFAPHPVKVLRPEIYLPYITSIPHRLQLIESLGVDVCIVVRFTKSFAQLSPENFIQRYLVDHIRPEEILVGEEFRFGRNREGTIETFQQAGAKLGFTADPMKSVKGLNGKIGSSAIRKLIAAGNISEAAQYLGRFVSLLGKVIKGDGRGKKIGFPTANIMLDDEVLPPLGVYVVLVKLDHQTFKGMANVGHRPSFKDQGSPITLEVHIFDFDKNIYGKNILIEFVEKIREEKKFPNVDSLTSQLSKDAAISKKILAKY